MKYGGCCATSRCCCGISEHSPAQCSSVNDLFEMWMTINKCRGRGEERASVAPRSAQEVSWLLGQNRNGAEREHKLRFVVDAEQELREGTRVSTTCVSGLNCAANTTMCSIRNLGHFYPGRRKTIATPSSIRAHEIATFLLRGACEARGKGSWEIDTEGVFGGSSHGGYCNCLRPGFGGRYCLRSSSAFDSP